MGKITWIDIIVNKLFVLDMNSLPIICIKNFWSYNCLQIVVIRLVTSSLEYANCIPCRGVIPPHKGVS